MFDYVAQLPYSVLKSLLNIVAVFYRTCSSIWHYLTINLQDSIVELMLNLDLPESIVNAVNTILSGPWAWVYRFSLFELLLGGALISVVVFGIIKFFTDIIL